MNTLLGLIAVLAVGVVRARNLEPASTGVKYDQRQEGKVNVQIDVKDVQVLALVDNDMIEDYIQNYDYAYDYADFTIKPGSKPTKPPTTTAKPTSPASSSKATNPTTPTSSSKASTPATPVTPTTPTTPTTTTKIVSEKLNFTGITNSPIQTVIIGANGNETVGVKVIVADENFHSNKTSDQQQQQQQEQVASAVVTSSTVVPATHPESRKRCPVGFQLKSGRCFKRHSPAEIRTHETGAGVT